MKLLDRGRYAVGLVVAVTVLAGCGGSQTPSVVSQGAMPQIMPMSNYQVIYRFRRHSDGTAPTAGLTKVDGTLYGTTMGGGAKKEGTVYSISTTGSEEVLHSFGRGSDGLEPWARLIDVKGTLYGTTRAGGLFNKGTVYSITTTGVETVLYNFKGGPDGLYPEASLVNVRGLLYGTTSDGGSECGSSGCGTVFRISTTGKKKVLYSFKGGTDGNYPEGELADVSGTLYGTTYAGGGIACGYLGGCGTVYSISTTGAEKVIHHFKPNSDGRYPQSGLINVSGTLYGTTLSGRGPSDRGTVYSMSTTGVEKVLHRFSSHGSGGTDPGASLIAVNGTLYGTTGSGGKFDDGIVYSVTATGFEKVLHSFDGGSDGMNPDGALIDVKGMLYGTTGGGGRGTCCGTVFAFSP